VTRIRLWVGLIISALCVYLVARRVNWPSFVAALAHVHPAWLAAGMVASAASYGFSGLRWRHVISREATLTRREAFHVVAIGNLANVVAPSRAGDFARSALVARWKAVPVSRVLGGVLVERYADVVMLIALAGVLWFAVRFPTVVQVGVLSFAVAGVAAIVAVLFMADRLPRLIGRIIGMVAPSFGASVANFLHGLFTGIRSAAHAELFAGTLGLSTIVWTFAGIAMLCNVRAFDLQVPWYSAFFVLLVVNLGGVIPASPGSLGLYHYLAMLALAVWITDADRALGFAVVAHATGLGVTTLLGLGSLAARHESLFRLTTA
jgi:glycosyltransferase 2 family protein